VIVKVRSFEMEKKKVEQELSAADERR